MRKASEREPGQPGLDEGLAAFVDGAEVGRQAVEFGALPGGGVQQQPVFEAGLHQRPGGQGTTLHLGQHPVLALGGGGQGLEQFQLHLAGGAFQPHFERRPNRSQRRFAQQGGHILLAKTLISEDMGYYALFIDGEGNKMGLHAAH